MVDYPVQCYRVSSTFRMLGSLPVEDVELYLTVCGTERCSPDKFYGPIVRRDYHVHFILSGKRTLEMDGKAYSLHRGQIFVTVPNVNVFYYSDPEDPWHYAWVSFNGAKAALYLEKAGLTRESPIRDVLLEPEEFLSVIEEILNHHEITIANELTRPYLTHIFKQKMDISPQEYLLSYRLEQGSRLLRTTGMSIQEIAGDIGYENPLTFSKMFKSAYGDSPRNYRMKVQGQKKGEPFTGNG